ncbi:sugar ABC transporter permease [Thermanaerothrix sp.]|jgi:multiple sugar transport system permease protein|uniref:carbohydrate ABC transporter permease n=1 Tax=Thermanaerothrix sp. TaxID=2972675 RepID=UPI002ADD4D6D|nr:sugar ABC transporter permease [Thermanaerothrix sp.]
MEAGIKPLGREKVWLWILLAPTLFGLVFSAFGALLATLGLSFTEWDLFTSPKWVGFSNYITLFTDKRFLRALANTAQFAALYVPGVVIISLFVAVLMNRAIKGISLYRTMYYLPVVTSAVATALVWNMIYGKDTGVLNYILKQLGMQPVCWLCADRAMLSVVIVNIWGAIGEGMIIFLAGLTAIPKEYYEASEIDGAGRFQQFFRITLPLITPSIFFQTLISTINAFQAFDYIYMLTRRGQGDSSIPVVVFSIYRNAWHFNKYGVASAQAIELTLIVAALMAVYLWAEKKFVVYE